MPREPRPRRAATAPAGVAAGRTRDEHREPVGHDDDALHTALLALPPTDAEVLRLWAWEDLAPREIAVVLGTTANAVSIRLHRAKQRLRAELAGPPGGPGPARKDGAPPGHLQQRQGRTATR